MSEPMSDEQLKKIEDGVDWAESLKQSTWLAKSVRDCLGYIYQLDRENRKARELLETCHNILGVNTPVVYEVRDEIRAFLDGEESK